MRKNYVLDLSFGFSFWYGIQFWHQNLMDRHKNWFFIQIWKQIQNRNSTKNHNLVKNLQKVKPKSLDEVDPELLATFEKLGISLNEQKRLTGVAIDAVIDSVSVATTFKDTLKELGIIFCSFSELGQLL